MLAERRPDIILGASPKAGLLSMLAGKAVGVDKRVFQHWGARWETASGGRRRLLMEADRLSMAAATHVLAVSDSLADLVFAEGLAKSRPVVLGLGGSKGVDRSLFAPRWKTASEPPTFGFLGRLTPDKGIDELLRAFRIIRSQMPEARLLVGGEVDAANPIPAVTLAALVGSPGVWWLGGVDNASEFFRQLDVFVFPSLREGLPNVVIEAAASGVPTVAWNVTGVRNAVLPGKTGSLVMPGDVQVLADAAMQWCQQGPLSTVACREWSAHFSQDVVAGHLVEFLEGVLSSHP